MQIAVTIKDPKMRLNSYIFQKQLKTVNEISSYTEQQLDMIRSFLNSIIGRNITDVSIFNNRLIGKNEGITRCIIKDYHKYDFNNREQTTKSLFNEINTCDIKQKEKISMFFESLLGKTLSFKRKDRNRDTVNQYQQTDLPILNTRNNCVIFSSKSVIDKLTKTLAKYKALYAPDDKLVYGNYVQEVKAKNHGFISNWLGIIIIILGMAFIIFKMVQYLK